MVIDLPISVKWSARCFARALLCMLLEEHGRYEMAKKNASIRDLCAAAPMRSHQLWSKLVLGDLTQCPCCTPEPSGQKRIVMALHKKDFVPLQNFLTSPALHRRRPQSGMTLSGMTLSLDGEPFSYHDAHRTYGTFVARCNTCSFRLTAQLTRATQCEDALCCRVSDAELTTRCVHCGNAMCSECADRHCDKDDCVTDLAGACSDCRPLEYCDECCAHVCRAHGVTSDFPYTKSFCGDCSVNN